MAENYIRRAQYHFTTDHLIRTAESIGSWEKVQSAIGYLSTWNLSYPICNIYTDGDTDFTAVYLDDTGTRQYVIGAVWHGEHYGFHS